MRSERSTGFWMSLGSRSHRSRDRAYEAYRQNSPPNAETLFLFPHHRICGRTPILSLSVSVLTQTGSPVDGYDAATCLPLSVDSVAQRVQWNSKKGISGLIRKTSYGLIW
jgi:hypothetical protein